MSQLESKHGKKKTLKKKEMELKKKQKKTQNFAE